MKRTLSPTPWAALVCALTLLLLLLGGCDKARSDSVRLTNRGVRAYEKNELRIAKTRFQEAIEVYGDNAKAHHGLAMVLRRLAEKAGYPGPPDQALEEKAEKHFKEALRLNPKLVEPHYDLGEIAFRRGETDKAEQSLRRVLEQDADHGSAQFLLGRIHEKKGNLREAEVAFRRAVTLEPYRCDIYHELARLYRRVKAEDAAMAVLKEGIRLSEGRDPSASLSLLHNELGVMLQERNQYGQAIDQLLKAVNMNGAPAAVPFNLGWAYAGKGDWKHAQRYFGQFVNVAADDNPAIPIAREVQRHLKRRIERSTGQPPSGG